MTTTTGPLTELIRQGPSVRRISRFAYYGTTLTDFLISGGPLAILLFTFWSNQQPAHDHFRLINYALISGAIVYSCYFLLRASLKAEWRIKLSSPRNQWLRCQIGIIGVSLLIGLLAMRNEVRNELWLLYVLATISLSARVTTPILLATLFEVTLAYISATLIGFALAYLEFGPYALQVGPAAPDMLVRIVWMWLLTFLLHSLVRYVQFRDDLSLQQQSWLSLIEDNVVSWEQPDEQREVVIRSAERLTESQADLWLPRFDDGRLINRAGADAPSHVLAAAASRRPTITARPSASPSLLARFDARAAQWPLRPSQLWALLDEPSALAGSPDLLMLDDAPDEAAAQAEIILPICRLDPDQELLGVLRLQYTGETPSPFQLKRYATMLRDFTGPARVILIVSQQHEREQRVERLAASLSSLLTTQEIATQVVNGLVDDWGFDFATFSVVDSRLNLIRSIAGRNANWVDVAQHPLTGDDVQSLVVRTGKVYHNDGVWEPCLDRRIWRKYQHDRLTRVWMPIGPARTPGAVIGTLETGFFRARVPTVSPAQTALLADLAGQVYVALVNALQLERQRELADALAQLNETSDRFQKIRDVAGIYDENRVAQMIGENAEAILKGDIVMVYGWEAARDHLDLLYTSPDPAAIRGRSELHVRLTEDGVLRMLHTTRQSYFSANAQQDPLLANLDPTSTHRTFTQRQNIKSFAGLPLLSRSEQLVGFLCINYRSNREFHGEERRLLEVFARQAAMALEEARSQRLIERQIVAQERGKLAANLHDSLSQNLYWSKQYVSTALVYAQRDDRERTLNNLGKVSDLITTSLQAFHEMLQELRDGQNPQTDFVGELQETLERLKAMDSFRSVTFEPRLAGGPLPAAVQFYLMRIAREALFNAARHARQACVHIVYCQEKHGAASLTVTDDGPGFDMERVLRAGRHTGLDAIEYYASRINARSEIRTALGQGVAVSVQVCWPLEEETNA